MLLNKLIYYSICTVVLILLSLFISQMARLKKPYARSMVFSMSSGFFVIPIYSFFAFSENFALAFAMRCLYYAFNGWLTFWFLVFAFEYDIFTKKQKSTLWIKILFTLMAADTIMLIVNSFTGFMFNINQLYNVHYGYLYWETNFKWPMAYHLALTYGCILAATIMLIYETEKAPTYYKMRYAGILAGYLLIVFIHGICFFIDTYVDISVLLYGFMGLFVSYYIYYATPQTFMEQSLTQFNDTINDVILYFNDKGRCIFANRKAHVYFRKNGTFSLAMVEEYRSEIDAKFSDENKEKIEFNDSKILNNDLKIFECEYQKFYDQKNIMGYFLRLKDKTQEVNRFNEQRHIATHDQLTGLYNRDYFFQKVEELLKKDPSTPRYMLCSNIVDFKLVNEILGADFGDEVLRKQAQLLHRLSRGDDLYCRINDDKFAYFLRTSWFEEKKFLEGFKALQKLTESESFKLQNEIGIYEVHNPKEKAQVMIDKALMAVEEQHTAGKIFYYYNSEFMERQLAERNMVNRFEDALKKDEFKIQFQPVFNKNKKIVGAEALSCWEYSQSRIINGDFYNEVLEKYGLLYKLDQEIWEAAFKFLSGWQQNGHPDFKMFIRVSVEDYYYFDIYEFVNSLTKKYKIKNETITFEFFEKTISQDFRNINELFTKLRKDGFKVLINQFGNGYSSLNLIKDTHVDSIKIDSKFINNTNSPDCAEKILKFIVQLSNVMGIEAYLDGIETEYQMDALKKAKISIFQGPYLSSPLLINDFVDKFLK